MTPWVFFRSLAGWSEGSFFSFKEKPRRKDLYSSWCCFLTTGFSMKGSHAYTLTRTWGLCINLIPVHSFFFDKKKDNALNFRPRLRASRPISPVTHLFSKNQNFIKDTLFCRGAPVWMPEMTFIRWNIDLWAYLRGEEAFEIRICIQVRRDYHVCFDTHFTTYIWMVQGPTHPILAKSWHHICIVSSHLVSCCSSGTI